MKTIKFTLLTLLFAMTIASCSKKDEPVSSSTIVTPPVTPPKKDTTVVTPPNTPILPQTTIDSIKGKLINIPSGKSWVSNTGLTGTFMDLGNNTIKFVSSNEGLDTSFTINLNTLSSTLYNSNSTQGYSDTIKYELDGSSNTLILSEHINLFIIGISTYWVR